MPSLKPISKNIPYHEFEAPKPFYIEGITRNIHLLGGESSSLNFKAFGQVPDSLFLELIPSSNDTSVLYIMNKDSNNLMRNINNKLRKNYRILCELNPEEKGKTTKTKLLSKGFDFEFFTSMLQTKTGNTYFFLYDQGYRALEDDFYMLVKKDS
mgnify:CR=1 FL=1